MKRSVLIILELLLLTGSAPAIVIHQIRFIGNRHFSSSELTDLLDIKRNRDSEIDFVRNRIRSIEDSMIANDYLFARVDSFRIDSTRTKNRLSVYLQEGPLANVSSLRWLGETDLISPSAYSRLIVREGARFRWSSLQFDIESLLDAHEDAGYPFAKVEIIRIEQDSLDTASVQIELKVTSGPFVRLLFVRFTGNQITRSDFLLRESRLRINEPYSRKIIQSAKRYLTRLPFIRRVTEPRIIVSDLGETGLEVEVEETRMSRVDIVAGYSPGTDNNDGTFSGLVDLELMNFFGGGRKARIHWERPDEDTQEIDLAYIEPWFLNQPVSAELDFNQRIQDTLYVTRQFGGKISIALSSFISVWGSAQREAVIVDSADGLLIDLESNRTNYLESGIQFDSRDHPLNPRSGLLFSTFVGQGWRYVEQPLIEGASQDFVHQRIGVDSEINAEVIPFWILSIALHARSLESDEPEIRLPDLYRLGGARTLRGYREEQFLGSRIGWATLELRYWLGPASRVFLFSDAGGAFREYRELDLLTKSTTFKTSAGLGLRLETGLGVWGIDYGIGESDNFLNGKLHISLYGTF